VYHRSGAIRTTPTAALEIIIGITPLSVYVKQEAMSACNRLRLVACWVSTNCGRTLIHSHLSQLILITRMRCDKILTKFIFGNNYAIQTPFREDWDSSRVRLDKNVVCFTDGSWYLTHIGSSYYNQSKGENISIPLGT